MPCGKALDYLLKPFEAGYCSTWFHAWNPCVQQMRAMSLWPTPRRQRSMVCPCCVKRRQYSDFRNRAAVKKCCAIPAQTPTEQKAVCGCRCSDPENMLESMLFGYEKGAYTGAHQARAGKFEQANGGTILLDEISEMPLRRRPSFCAYCRSASSSGSGATR